MEVLYTYLITGLSHTGTIEFNTLMDIAQLYQEQVERTIYDKYQTRYWKTGHFTGTQVISLFERPKSIPDMQYAYTPLEEVLQAVWADFILLLLFGVLFLVVAFLRFTKYDVR